MNLVLSGPIDDALRNAVVATVRPSHVVQLHASAYRFHDAACDAAVKSTIQGMCDAARVDHAYVEQGLCLSHFRLLAMDMDSTLITIECIDELADLVGRKAEVVAITEAAMRGEIPDFAESLRRRVALLAGESCSALQRVYDERLRLSVGAETLLAAARQASLGTLLVSGGFTSAEGSPRYRRSTLQPPRDYR